MHGGTKEQGAVPGLHSFYRGAYLQVSLMYRFKMISDKPFRDVCLLRADDWCNILRDRDEQKAAF